MAARLVCGLDRLARLPSSAQRRLAAVSIEHPYLLARAGQRVEIACGGGKRSQVNNVQFGVFDL
jgi:hypothetical protein